MAPHETAQKGDSSPPRGGVGTGHRNPWGEDGITASPGISGGFTNPGDGSAITSAPIGNIVSLTVTDTQVSPAVPNGGFMLSWAQGIPLPWEQ